ncbi:MAG: ABC transporter ATP-binding protein [Armatimonadota bacterium]|nr:MAG: ABC transporter ATP-binding protein [Armatimonadota bacterium]
MEPLLSVQDCTMRFGGLTAVKGLNLQLFPQELVGLIGPNGAGKTTVFNLLTGVYRPVEGHIIFQGRDITGWKPHAIARLGIARTFQNIRLFGSMTVLQNVKVGARLHMRTGLWHATWRTYSMLTEEQEVEREAWHLLREMGLDDMAHHLAHNLPYGKQRRLEIARALATHPRLLLLDEPAAGMNPQETADLMELIRRLRDEYNVTILLIEHDMKVVMGICERVIVLDYGEEIAQGTPQEIRTNPRVIEAYLGEAPV